MRTRKAPTAARAQRFDNVSGGSSSTAPAPLPPIHPQPPTPIERANSWLTARMPTDFTRIHRARRARKP